MEYHGNFSAASRQAEKVDVRYMCVPSIGAMLTAAPRDHWNTEKAGNAAEVEEYSLEMAQLLFERGESRERLTGGTYGRKRNDYDRRRTYGGV